MQVGMAMMGIYIISFLLCVVMVLIYMFKKER